MLLPFRVPRRYRVQSLSLLHSTCGRPLRGLHDFHPSAHSPPTPYLFLNNDRKQFLFVALHSLRHHQTIARMPYEYHCTTVRGGSNVWEHTSSNRTDISWLSPSVAESSMAWVHKPDGGLRTLGLRVSGYAINSKGIHRRKTGSGLETVGYDGVARNQFGTL